MRAADAEWTECGSGVALDCRCAWGLRRLPWLRSWPAALFAAPAVAAPDAAIVVDARTGKALYANNADAKRYPASLTKMMTLYLLFEAIDSGKTSLNARITISDHAAAQAPSKLGLKPGQTIKVRDAILALVTKSANDVAVAIGEYVAGSEPAFAKLMTQRAHDLGMSHTVFKNANGLPNAAQYSTARDLATLGRRFASTIRRTTPISPRPPSCGTAAGSPTTTAFSAR